MCWFFRNRRDISPVLAALAFFQGTAAPAVQYHPLRGYHPLWGLLGITITEIPNELEKT